MNFFDKYKFSLILNTYYYIKSNSYLEEKESYLRLKKCNGKLINDLNMMLIYDFEYSDLSQFNNFDKWMTDCNEWSNSGLYSGKWENMRTFINKKSIIIGDSVFLIYNSVKDFNQIVFHPFIKENSL